jgi:hypothetical protein
MLRSSEVLVFLCRIEELSAYVHMTRAILSSSFFLLYSYIYNIIKILNTTTPSPP